MNNWNGIDFFIFLILVLNTVVGMRRGATKEIISLLCLSAALIITIKFTVPLQTFLMKSPLIEGFLNNRLTTNFMEAIGAGPLTSQNISGFNYGVSLLICFVGVFSLCDGALSMSGFNEYFSFPYAVINRQLGAALGLLRGYVISLIFLSILFHMYSSSANMGTFATGLASQTQQLDQIISGQNPENYQRIYQNQPTELYKVIPASPSVFGSHTTIGQ